MTIRDGGLTSFWFDRWVGDEPLSCAAPEIFKLARFKRLTVKEGLSNGRWMTGMNRMTSPEQLTQFIHVWEKIQSVTLSDGKDEIRWSFTAGGAYLAASAYAAQFLPRIRRTSLRRVWSCKIEGKVKFYIWLLLQNRNWTADRLKARGWPHNQLCKLCDQEAETADHITLSCVFAKETWFQFRGSYASAWAIASGTCSVEDWWEKLCSSQGSKAAINDRLTLSAYMAWNLWKERNRRVFEQRELTPMMLASVIKEEVSTFTGAMRNNPL